MTKKQINQNDSYKNELLNSIDNEYIYESAPISRIKNKIYNSEDKLKSLFRRRSTKAVRVRTSRWEGSLRLQAYPPKILKQMAKSH